MASSAADHPQSQSAPVATTTESNPVVGANNFDARIDDTRIDDTRIDTNVGAKANSHPALTRMVSSNPNLNICLNILRLKATPIMISAVKSDAKADVKSDAKSVSNPDSNPASNLNAKSIAKPAPDPAPDTKPSSPAFPPVTIAARPTDATPSFMVFGKSSVAAPASRLAEPASNSQPPSPQPTANPASAPALSPPLSHASPLTTPIQIVAPPQSLSSLAVGAATLAPTQVEAPSLTLTSPTSPTSNNQPDRNPTIAAAPALPRAVTSSAEAVPVSNSSKAFDVVSAASEVAQAPVNFRISSQAQPTSSAASHAARQAVADPAPSFRINPTQPLIQPAQSSIPPAPASQTSTGIVEPTSVTATSVLPTPVLSAPASLVSASAAQSASPASPASAAPTPPAPPTERPSQAPIPTGTTITMLAPDPSSTARSQTVSPAPSTAAQAASAAPPTLTKSAPASLPSNFSQQPISSSVQGTARFPESNQASSVPLTSPAPTPTLTPAPTPTAFPIPQSPLSDSNSIPITGPQTGNQPASPPSSDPRVNAAPPDSAPTATPSGSSEPVNFRTGNSATEQIAISGSATIKPAPTQTVPSATAPVAAPTAGVPQAEADAGNNKLTGNTADNLAHNNFAPLTSNLAASNFAISNFGASNSVSSNFNASNFNSSNLGGSNLTPNLNAQAPTSASLAATAGDAANNAKPDFSQQQPAPETTSPTTAPDKKSSAAIPASATSTSSSGASFSTAPTVPTAPSAKDASVTLTPPAPAAAPPPTQTGSNSAPELPKAHQMLDSAPPAASAAPPAPVAPDSPADLQMNAQVNAQMHVGIRTDAFGSVEIHTVVQQSQVGITVQSDRDIARWFSSEVPSLESGLNQSHLHLTAVDFDNGRSGVQTATSFQHGQSQQHFSQTSGSSAAALPGTRSEEDTVSDTATIDILPTDLSIGPGVNRVSIHA